MRSAEEIQKLIIDIAKFDDRIRAILLNGSRANNKVLHDKLQVFDIVYIVLNLDSFTSDHSWTNAFGNKIIWQLPCETSIGEEDNERKSGFNYLMLFKDGNRIDLTLFPKERLEKYFHLDSLTVIWLDKDNLFSNISNPNEFDYLIKKPTEKEFLNTCNEFWWVSTMFQRDF
jgi:aminoglycoside 6-adenylyltransferase